MALGVLFVETYCHICVHCIFTCNSHEYTLRILKLVTKLIVDFMLKCSKCREGGLPIQWFYLLCRYWCIFGSCLDLKLGNGEYYCYCVDMIKYSYMSVAVSS
jgi:hypothetical protein